MDSFINTRKLLKSNDPEKIKKALLMLNKGNHPELIEDIESLQGHKDSVIQNVTKTIIRNYRNRPEDKPPEGCAVEDLMQLPDNLESFYKMFKTLQKSSQKQWLMKKINDYSVKPEEQEYKLPFIELYLSEKDRGICHMFSKILLKWFGVGVQRIFIENLSEKNWDIRINCIIGLMKFNSQEGVDKAVELYEETNNIDFIYFASCYLWKYSHLQVISKLKKIVHGNQNERIVAANICSALRHSELKGIITFLLEDKNEQVRSRAKVAFSKIERTVVESKSANDYSHLTDDFLQKFRVILKHGHDFQKKIMVMKIIDNLAKTEFIDLVESQLKNEKNHFLISSYVKFLGKYGGIKYVKILKPYLESKDERIVANCLEGLANCGTDEELDEIFCRFITGQNHRIASISAMALWNNGKKKIVIDYIDNNINNRKLWIRKAIINILQQINSSELSSQIQVLCQDKNKEIRKTAKAIIADFDKVNGVSDSPTELIQYILDNGKIPDKIISDIIVKIKSKDKSLSERIQAIEFLSYVATEEHYKKIYKLYRGARNQVMKAALVKTLGITFSGGREFLLDILKEDFDPKIIASALEGLGFYDCSLYVDDIFPFLYHEDRKIVANAAVLLYEIMPEEILRKFSVMIDSPSEAVRKSSVFALAEIKTYESYLLIRKLLNDADLDIAISASKIIAVFDKETDFLELFEKEKDDNSVKKVSKEDSSELKTDLLIEYFNKLDTSTVEEIGSLINDIGKLVNQDNIDFLLSYIETSQNEMAISKIISLLGMFLDIPRVYDLVDLFLNGDDYSHIRSVISGFNNVYENPYFIEKLMEYLSSENIGLSEIAFRILLSNPVYGKEMYRLIDNSDSEVKPVFDYIIKKLPSTWLPVTVQSVAEEKSPEVVENHLKGFIDDISEHISDDSKTEIQEETVIESEKTPVETIEEDHVEDNKIVLDNFFYILNEMSDSKNNDDLDETICELKRMDLKDYTSEMIKLIEKSDNEQLVLELCSFLGKYSSEMDVFNILEKLLRHKDTNIRCRIIESLVDSPEPVFFEDLSAMIFKEEFLVVKSAWKVFLLNRVYGESYFQKFDKKMYEKYLKPEIKNPKSSVKIPEKKSRKNQLSDTPVISQKLAFISLNMKQTFAITAGSIVLIFLFFFAGYLSSGTLIEPIFSNGKKASVIFTDSNDLSVDQLKTNWIEFKNENAPSDKITSTLIGYIQNSEKNFGTETFNRVKTSLKSGDIKIADQEFMSVIAHLKNGDVLKDGKKWIKRQIVEKAIFDNIKKILVQ